MSTKKRWMFILAATLILTFANAAAVFAAEAADASDVQTEESDKQRTPTIVAGTTAAEKAAKAAKAAAEAAQKQEVPVPESKVIEAGKASRTTDQEEQEAAAASDTETTASTASVKSLGIFKTTGYCPCYQCSEGWGRHTCTGAIARSGHTIAVDPRVIPYGSQVIINGVQYTAEDRGGAVRGNHIDIFYDTHAQTRQHGMRNAEVFLVL